MSEFTNQSGAKALHSSKLLAFDTSTETMFIAVANGEQVWQHTGEGGAKTSATLIPAIMALLREANVQLADLDAIVFGRGGFIHGFAYRLLGGARFGFWCQCESFTD